jgi:hypothetical protein
MQTGSTILVSKSTLFFFRSGDIKLHTTSDGVQYIELNERQTKTRTGANIAVVREVTPKIYELGGDNDPIKMYKIYPEKRPLDFSGPEDPFYLAPRTIPLDDSRSARWFLKQKVGQKKLSSIVRRHLWIIINALPTTALANTSLKNCAQTTLEAKI